MTLTEFLLARITEDEAWGARHPDWCRAVADDQACDCDGSARVLVECEAKRRFLREAEDQVSEYFSRFILETLALPYADHPDFNESWRP